MTLSFLQEYTEHKLKIPNCCDTISFHKWHFHEQIIQDVWALVRVIRDSSQIITEGGVDELEEGLKILPLFKGGASPRLG